MTIVIRASSEVVTAHQIVGKAHIEIVELGSLDYFPLDHLCVSGYLVAHKGILQNLIVCLYGLCGYSAIAGDVGIVDHFTIGNGGRFHKLLKRFNILDGGFVTELLPQIYFHVAFKAISRIVYKIVTGYHSILYSLVNLEVCNFLPN